MNGVRRNDKERAKESLETAMVEKKQKKSDQREFEKQAGRKSSGVSIIVNHGCGPGANLAHPYRIQFQHELPLPGPAPLPATLFSLPIFKKASTIESVPQVSKKIRTDWGNGAKLTATKYGGSEIGKYIGFQSLQSIRWSI